MKIWLDTTNVAAVKKANSLGILHGITTNPALIAQSGKTMRDVLQALLDNQDGPVAAQVVARDAKGMIKQGEALYDFSDRIIVKIPVTADGLEAINVLSKKDILTMATIVFQPHQALIAALAGADFLAPYVGHIEKSGANQWEVLKAILTIYHENLIGTEVLSAAINSVEQVTKCAEIGIPHITLKDTVFDQLIATTEMTAERENHFSALWEKSKLSFL